jgi:ribosomal protein S18 acetylase RimI-like enzyme
MPQDTLMIRRATLNDLHKICELGQVVNQLHHQAYPGIFLPQNEPLRDMAHWQRAVQGDDSVCFVALGETQGPALGFVTAYQVDESHSMLHPMRYLRIGTVCVDVAVRGQGIACRLMAEV